MDGKACISAGPQGVARFKASNFGIGKPKFYFDCLQVPVKQNGITLVDKRFVNNAHEQNLQVHVWTIDDPTEMNRLIDLGVDGIMTDKPALLKEILTERKLWS
jgi:glycerophosphoryl diester phosphodiesterase